MKFLIMLVTVSIFFQSCCSAGGFPSEGGAVSRSYTAFMKKTRGYSVVGTGASMPRDKIKSLYVSFNSFEEADLPKARKLYIEAIDAFIAKINEDEAVRPYLENYPATEKNVEVDLSFMSDFGKFRETGISSVALVSGDICYRTYDLQRQPRSNTIYREPYEIAVQIVKGELPDPYIQPTQD